MIALGCDHGGFELKEHVKNYLVEKGIEFKDFGAETYEPLDDFPDFAEKVCRAIQNNECDRGILICGTGVGVSIIANKFHGIRAALCSDTFTAHSSREHNNSNVLTFGARVIGRGLALDIVDAWLKAEFLGGKYQRREEKIAKIENER